MKKLVGVINNVKVFLEDDSEVESHEMKKVSAMLNEWSKEASTFNQVAKCSITCPQCKEVIEFYDTSGTEKVAVANE